MKKQYLMTPGPTTVPSEALSAMGRPIFHHRTPRYKTLFKEVNEGLQYVFKTKNRVLTFASSGTGAMEGAVVNLLSPGDTALAVVGGKFGERWADICKAYGINVIEIPLTWGEAVDPKVIREKLESTGTIKAVYTTLCETSTGVLSDIKAIGKVMKGKDALLVVDAISGLGADDIRMDEWGVDVLVGGSQKGLMIPPGLAFAALSERACQAVEASKIPTFYFSFKKAMKSVQDNDTPFTPAVSLVAALNESLSLIRKEGIENVLARHALLAQATKAGVTALGLKLFAPTSPANAVTAVKVPEGIDGQALVKTMRDKYGVAIAGGQAQAKGKIFRIAHLGYVTQFDVILALSAVEIVLAEMGYKSPLGAGLKAAQEVFAGTRQEVCAGTK